MYTGNPGIRRPTSSEWQEVESTRRRDPPRNLPRNRNAERSPHKWNGPKGLHRTDPRKRAPAPRLIDVPDNEAEALWRANHPATDQIRIPDDLVLKDKSDKSGKYHEVIARQHGTFIYSEHRHGNGGSMEFGIWGDKDAVAATKFALLEWIEECGFGKKSARSARFAKVVSLTPKLRERAEKAWAREVTKHKYRRDPIPGHAFVAIGSFLWPVQEYKPEEILGCNYEALDPIRMDCASYVCFKKERNMFLVLGMKPENVVAGVQRMRQTCFQIAARQFTPIRLYLLHWPDVRKVPLSVWLEAYDPPSIISLPQTEGQTIKPRKAPQSDEENASEALAKRGRMQTRLSHEHLRTSILKVLGKLHYYRGYLQMRIRLGVFLVNQYIEPTHKQYELEEYEEMLRASQFSGEVTQELGHTSTEQALLSVLQSTVDLVYPSEATTQDLKEVKPVYAASFTFSDPGGSYRLTAEWSETYNHDTKTMDFDSISKRWTRLDRDASTLSPLLDVSLCDLSQSSAWQFDILASPQVVDESKLSAQLLSFSRTLKIDPRAALSGDAKTLFVTFNPYTNLTSLQQRISYQYIIVNTDYILELSRFQDRTYPSRNNSSALNASSSPSTTEPRWSLGLFRKAWDVMLASNERLPVGERADWSDEAATWFPYDVGPGSAKVDLEDHNQGWEQLMEKLGRIGELVKDVKESVGDGGEDDDDLIGGMIVG